MASRTVKELKRELAAWQKKIVKILTESLSVSVSVSVKPWSNENASHRKFLLVHACVQWRINPPRAGGKEYFWAGYNMSAEVRT